MRQNLQLNCNGFRLVFVKEVDRWLHQVTAAGTVFFSSIEGDSNDDWPPSPPLQDLDQHELDENRLAVLGVGKSGNSHWSASFESMGCSGIQIELACLSGKSSPEFASQLGSRYRLANQIQASQAEPGFIQLRSSDPSSGKTHNQFDLIVSSLSGDDWFTELQVIGDELFIRPTRISSEPRKPTRWGYLLRSRV